MSDKRQTGPTKVAVDKVVEISTLPTEEELIRRRADFAVTQNRMAIIVTTGMTIGMLLIIIGGLIGRFDGTFVAEVCTAYAAGFSLVLSFFFFKRARQGRRH